jgi:hypothetical protein
METLNHETILHNTRHQLGGMNYPNTEMNFNNPNVYPKEIDTNIANTKRNINNHHVKAHTTYNINATRTMFRSRDNSSEPRESEEARTQHSQSGKKTHNASYEGLACHRTT